MIILENVSKSFGKTKALDAVSFRAESGQITGFLGPNGAGKTTSMRLISGCMRQDAGTLTVNGLNHDADSLKIRRNLGYLPENSPLYPDMTVMDYLFMAARLRDMGHRDARKAVARMVELCGLGQRLKQRLGTLSKGFRQRVGLAQAMVHDPDVLILDEPTTGLDPNQIRYIKDLIKELGKRKTLLLSTHILHQIPELCDYVVILEEGAVVFAGTPEELANRAGAPTSALLEINSSPEEIQRFFEKEEAVAAVHHQQTHNGYHRFRLEGEFNTENMAGIAARLHARNWQTPRWTAEPVSLDHIFATLTLKDRHENPMVDRQKGN